MVQTTHLQYAYSGGSVLHFPDIQVEQASHWLLLGQSGSGKTTLLHLIGGLLSPRTGNIRIGDTALDTLRGRALDSFRGRNIGIIFQKAHFIRSLSVEQNLLLAQQLAGSAPDKARIRNLIARLGLESRLHASPDALSVGEQQRVAIARALVNQPLLILADEPTSALDDANAAQVADLLEEQARLAKATLMVVTHDNRLKSRFPNQIHLQSKS
ncbi:MAG: ABC transporter ATP-binding protein [Haliscomenobacter sp.]